MGTCLPVESGVALRVPPRLEWSIYCQTIDELQCIMQETCHRFTEARCIDLGGSMSENDVFDCRH